MHTITQPVRIVCMHQTCMHWLVHAYQYCRIGIDNRDPADGDGFQCSSSSASSDDYDDETLLKKLRMHLRTPKITKISWGSMPLQWMAAGWPCYLLQLMTLPPRWNKLCTALFPLFGEHGCSFSRLWYYDQEYTFNIVPVQEASSR